MYFLNVDMVNLSTFSNAISRSQILSNVCQEETSAAGH